MTLSNPKHRGWLGVIFFVSLALNLFLLGWVLGDTSPQGRNRQGKFVERFYDRLEALPAGKREEVRPIIDAHREQLREQYKKIKATRQEVRALFAEEDFPRAQVEAKFEEMQAESLKMQEIMQAMMLEVAAKLTPEQRAEFLKRSDRR